jgi:hypothetical protein
LAEADPTPAPQTPELSVEIPIVSDLPPVADPCSLSNHPAMTPEVQP